MLRPALALAAAVVVAAPAAASAQLPDIPRKAKKVTVDLLETVTYVRTYKEVRDEEKWPRGIIPVTERCVVKSRWRGVCDYYITGSQLDAEGFYTLTQRCEGTVTVKVGRRTHRVSSRKRETSCATS